MLTFCLALVLQTPGFLVGVDGLTEHIRVSDQLVIDAEYAPEESVLALEAMVMSVEDFAILQAEVESSSHACSTRLDDLLLKQQETIVEMQLRCDERNANLTKALKEATKLNTKLTESLKDTKSSLTLQKWISIGLVAVTVGVSTWAVVTTSK